MGTLNPREYRKQKIEEELLNFELFQELYDEVRFSNDQGSIEHHKGQIQRTKERLKQLGIDANTYLEALEKYEELQRSWENSERSGATDIQAKWSAFCDAQEREEIQAYIQSEGLLGKPESSYSLTQKASLQRIKNTWQNTKRKNVG